MTRKFIALALLIMLAACSAPPELPATDCPREGGIGGTGECQTEDVSS
ncbi:MAG: hypothetical protein AB3N23_03385 [Paracoccaceae bacterium]